MARAVWSGAISFGLVNVPVKAYSAVRDHTVHFHQVDKASGSRIRYQKVAEKTGQEVSGGDVELGYEMDKGKLVVVDPEELASLRPRTTRTIDITDFVDIGDVDPVYYNRTYWLAPDGDAAARAYRLLVAAMDDRGKVGIGMVVMRNKQYLAAIRPRERALAMSTMRFADEVLDRSTVGELPDRPSKPPAQELRLATQIIDSLTTAWKPDQYRDTYTKEVQALIKRHQKGQDVVVEEAPAAKADVTDLMAALQASLGAARKAKGQHLSEAVETAAEALIGADDHDDDGAHTTARPSTRSARQKAKRPATSTPPGRRGTRRKSAGRSCVTFL